MNDATSLVAPVPVRIRTGRIAQSSDHAVVVLSVTGSVVPEEISRQLGGAVTTDRGEFRAGFVEGRPWLLLGGGRLDQLTREQARALAVAGHRRVAETGVAEAVWQLPHGIGDQALTGLVEGVAAAAYRPRRFVSETVRPGSLEVTIVDPAGRSEVVARAMTVAQAHCAARDLQNAPANLATPSALAARAEQLAAECEHLSVSVLAEQQFVAAGMGAFAAVARGAREPARLIQLRYEPPGVTGPLTAWVGKAITFDSGGINLKRGNGMAEMKFDMSGGAAVIEAIGAVARLRLPIRLLAIAGATENMPGSAAARPGDIVTTLSGRTVEITNTDAEGRLVLADCLTHAVRSGADRIVDIATLTGAVVTMFGGRYGALMSNDDGWAAAVSAAGDECGELVWRLPLHPWYRSRIDSDYADLANSRTDDGAATLLAGTFLERFVDGVPWAHIDALAWDLDHEEGLDGGAAVGLRLLVTLAGRMAAEGNNA